MECQNLSLQFSQFAIFLIKPLGFQAGCCFSLAVLSEQVDFVMGVMCFVDSCERMGGSSGGGLRGLGGCGRAPGGVPAVGDE